MPQRPEPYLTQPNLQRWSAWVWMLGLLALLAIGTEPQSPWARVLLGVIGLAFCVEGIDAIRTARAEFRFSMWYGFEATRREQPLRSWIYCALNFALGGWVLAVSVFSGNPNGRALSLRQSTSHGIVSVVPTRAVGHVGLVHQPRSQSPGPLEGRPDEEVGADLQAGSAAAIEPWSLAY